MLCPGLERTSLCKVSKFRVVAANFHDVFFKEQVNLFLKRDNQKNPLIDMPARNNVTSYMFTRQVNSMTNHLFT